MQKKIRLYPKSQTNIWLFPFKPADGSDLRDANLMLILLLCLGKPPLLALSKSGKNDLEKHLQSLEWRIGRLKWH